MICSVSAEEASGSTTGASAYADGPGMGSGCMYACMVSYALAVGDRVHEG